MKRVMMMLAALALGLSAACGSDSGGDKSCTSACSEGQAGSCTSIKGDCGKFCAALDALASPANCGTQKEAYRSCLNKTATVCAASCDAAESAMSQCYTVYCFLHSTDANCLTLAAAFK
jgi:hypothetical protein